MRRTLVTWNNQWLHPTESIYSIASKLAIANCVDIETALAYCGRFQPTAPFMGWQWHAPGQIGVSEQGTIHDLSAAWASAYEPFYYFSLRYCTACLAHGFHAVAHQNRLIAVCPVHGQELEERCRQCGGVFLPVGGLPWRCSSCGASLALTDISQWLSAFKEYPGGHPSIWTDAETAAFNAYSDLQLDRVTVDSLFSSDDAYWDKNWRKLALWYFNEILSVFHEWFSRHADCFDTGSMVGRLANNVAVSCPIERAFAAVTLQVWPNGGLWDAAQFDRATKRGVLYFLETLFSKDFARYLSDIPASLVIRDLAKAHIASALTACLAEHGANAASPAKYATAWQLKANTFKVLPATSREIFRNLSLAADSCCAKKA